MGCRILERFPTQAHTAYLINQRKRAHATIAREKALVSSLDGTPYSERNLTFLLHSEEPGSRPTFLEAGDFVF